MHKKLDTVRSMQTVKNALNLFAHVVCSSGKTKGFVIAINHETIMKAYNIYETYGILKCCVSLGENNIFIIRLNIHL